MKFKALFTLVAIVLSLSVFAQSSPPKAVDNSFHLKHPGIEDVVWTQVSEDQWAGNFTEGELSVQVVFDAQGKWLGSSTSMAFDQLPESVQTEFSKNHQPDELQEVSKVELSSEEVFYKILVLNNGQVEALTYYDDGSELEQLEETDE